MVSLEEEVIHFVLTKITMNAPNKAIREMDPDSVTKARPMLSPRVKQTILVPLMFCDRVCSLIVHIPPSDMRAL